MAADNLPDTNTLDNASSCVKKEYNSAKSRPADLGFRPGAEIHILPLSTSFRHTKDLRLTCFRCRGILPETMFRSLRLLRWNERKSYFVRAGMCDGCRKERWSELFQHPLLTGLASKRLKKLFQSAHRGAEDRGLVSALTEDDVYALWVSQGGLCALSGQRMVCYDKPLKDWDSPSIDRIDSDWNYTPDNIHLVCWAVNCMKSSMSVLEFRKWCAAVTVKQLNDEDALLAAASYLRR